MAGDIPEFYFKNIEGKVFSIESEDHVASMKVKDNIYTCEIHKFTSMENATFFYESLTKHSDPYIGCPLPIFTVEDESSFFVAISKDGIDMKTFLTDKKKTEMFYHQLRTVEGDFKVGVSMVYAKLIRDLITVVGNLHLKNPRLECSFSLDAVSLKVDPNNTRHFTVSINRLKLNEGSCGQNWIDLAKFIQTINRGVDIGDGRRLDALSTVEVGQVLLVLNSGNWKDVYHWPFFWDRDMRCNFICNLHAYFEKNPNLCLSDDTIVPVIGQDWRSKIESYEILFFLGKQLESDKKKYNIKSLKAKSTQHDTALAECLDFMRQTLHRFLTMMGSISSSGKDLRRCGIENKLDLILLYEVVFPGHIALLAARLAKITSQD